MPKQGLARGGVALLALACAVLVHCAPASEASTSSFPEAERLMGDARPTQADARGGFVFDTHRHVLSARVDGSPNIEIDTRGSHARIERIGATSKNAHLRGNVVRTSGDAERFVFARGEEIEELALLEAPTPLAYRFVVPEGFRLRALSEAIVQVDDASGDPWLRMRADRAWSEDRREIPISLVVEGDVVRVVVPKDAPYPLLVDPIWASASSMVKARDSHAATLLGDGRVLITGSFTFLDADTAEIFDPRTGLFTALTAKMTVKRSRHHSLMLPNGKVLIVGGTSQKPDAELFDPATNTFSPVASNTTMTGGIKLAAPLLDGKVLVKGLATNALDAMPAAAIFDPTTSTFTATNPGTLEARGTMVTLPNGKVLLFGECEIESYDPSTTNWTKLGGQFCSQPEQRGAALMRDGRVLVTGGTSCGGVNGTFCGSVRAYDPATETYDAVTAEIPPDGRGSSATLLPSGKVLVSGSYMSTTIARIYDPANGSFVAEADATPSSHRAQTVTVLPGGDVLILGGEQNTADIRTHRGVVSATNGNLGSPRSAAATQRLLDGKVLIAGGSNSGSSSYATAELYDPSTKTFSATTGSMTTAREHAIAALLPSGKVLIAGGHEIGTDAAKASAEVYDPATKQFTAVGSMTAARTRHAAARLTNGKILVAGGCSTASTCLQGLDATSSRLKSAELFDPVTQTFTATTIPMAVARSEHGLVPMFDGRVLVVATEGQGSLNTEVYDPKTGLFDVIQSLFMPTREHGRSALLLPSGKVFVGGGGGAATSGPTLITDATVANPSWTQGAGPGFGLMIAQYLPTAGANQLLLVGGVKPKGNGPEDGDTAESRIMLLQTLVGQNAASLVVDPGAGNGRSDVATANVDLGILVAGGDSGYGGGTPGTTTDTAWVYTDGADDSWRPQLSVAPAKIKAGKSTTLEGLRLTSTLRDTPNAFWQPAGSKTFIQTRIAAFSATNATWTAPVTALHGSGWLHVTTDGLASNSIAVEVEPAENGTACKYDAECGSGFCTEGVCCDQACDGACQACSVRRKKSGTDGTCATIQPGTDPDNVCVLGNGGACTTNAACGSGFCVGGVCCNEACNGTCRTCGTGTCQDTPTCGDAGPTDPPVICDGDHQLTRGGEFVAECGIYKCTPDAVCRRSCESAKDCVAPYICNYDGACVEAPFVRPAKESLFGCASSPMPANGTAAVFGFIVLAIGRSIRSRRGGAAR